jgi:putative holliday junction resolvase
MEKTKSVSKRIIGIDFGMARIGVAYSDESWTIASPFKVILADKKSAATVDRLLQELKNHQQMYHYDIEEIVVGLPLLMSGKVGLLADEVKHFVELLQQAINVPVVTWDERLTSVQADRSLRETNFTRKRRSQFVDTVAAVIILQNYLDYKKLKKELT